MLYMFVKVNYIQTNKRMKKENMCVKKKKAEVKIRKKKQIRCADTLKRETGEMESEFVNKK